MFFVFERRNTMKDPILNYQVNIAHYSWEFSDGRSHLNEFAIQYPEIFKFYKSSVIASAKTLFYHMLNKQPDDRLPKDSTDFINEYILELKSFLDDLIHQDGMYSNFIGELHFDVHMCLNYRYDTKNYEAKFIIHPINWNRKVTLSFIGWTPDFDKQVFFEVVAENITTLDNLTVDEIRVSVKTALLAFCIHDPISVNDILIIPNITSDEIFVDLKLYKSEE